MIEGINALVNPSASFAKDDGSTIYDSPTKLVADLLTKAGPEIIKGLGYITITEKEYQEIKEFTDQLVKEVKKPFDIYSTIFKWVTTNVEYTNGVNNDPYPVFKNLQGVCQGYANLLSVMLHSQKIYAFIANGILNPVGGHAWNYVYIGGNWYAIDTTWDDPVINTSNNIQIIPNSVKYKYFLKGSGRMQKTHIPTGEVIEGGKVFEYPELNEKDFEI